ncbi:MAG: hypothetical protein JO285_12575 [Kutzneria sp.]|nr:hypothetical protein [Kutzneria sp.]
MLPDQRPLADEIMAFLDAHGPGLCGAGEHASPRPRRRMGQPSPDAGDLDRSSRPCPAAEALTGALDQATRRALTIRAQGTADSVSDDGARTAALLSERQRST